MRTPLVAVLIVGLATSAIGNPGAPSTRLIDGETDPEKRCSWTYVCPGTGILTWDGVEFSPPYEFTLKSDTLYVNSVPVKWIERPSAADFEAVPSTVDELHRKASTLSRSFEEWLSYLQESPLIREIRMIKGGAIEVFYVDGPLSHGSGLTTAYTPGRWAEPCDVIWQQVFVLARELEDGANVVVSDRVGLGEEAATDE